MRVNVIRDPCLTSRQRRVVGEARLGELLRACGDRLAVPARANLSIRLTGEAELRDLNARFLRIDDATDVLAFPSGERDRVGDVAISVERAITQAPDGVAELRLLAVHGFLHCLGYDHALAEPAAAMTAATRMLLPDADVPDLQPAELWPS
jgi:probable rRNA maturation factor